MSAEAPTEDRATSHSAVQYGLFDTPTEERPTDRPTSFDDNLRLPVHNWFRYSAGFSALWVRDVLARSRSEGRCRVLDPFAGSGTVPLEAERAGMEGVGVEAHPFVFRVAAAKLAWRSSARELETAAGRALDSARHGVASTADLPPLLARCFDPAVLPRLLSLRDAVGALLDTGDTGELTWLAFVSIVRECTSVGAAQWQYVLPNKPRVSWSDPFEAFIAKARRMAGDMRDRQGSIPHAPPALVLRHDAREPAPIAEAWADVVLTSPPYLNNYDYADATRLEMTVLGEVSSWADLQNAVRVHLARSCTQHVARLVATTGELIDEEPVAPIRPELQTVCAALEAERHLHGGRKPYHTLVAAYFVDMANVWAALRTVVAPGAVVCWVIGDSAPYGIHVPVERWLGELALAAGFGSYRFEKTRDRNTRWRNRKHKVPLHEGRLWVEG